jgi:hypothetical protein
MVTMPPRAQKLQPVPDEPVFDDWDELVEEAHVDRPPYRLRVPVEVEIPEDATPEQVEELKNAPVEYEFLEIPCPSGAAYIGLVHSQRNNDVAGVLLNITMSSADDEAGSKLYFRLLRLLQKADFPVVDRLASRVVRHYFNGPKDAEPGESSAS